MSEITRDKVAALFTVDMETGRFFWRQPPKQHLRLLGLEAGGPRANHYGKRYWVIRIDGVGHKRGRLMFLLLNGRLPYPCVDHIDGDSLNDRPTNIREATVAENARNHKKRARRINLPMGVRVNVSGRFGARISFDGKQLHLGAYDTPEEARAVYLQKRKELYGQFA